MENASKALVLAGAVLISILLISIGILLINSTRSSTDSAKNTMSDLEITAFNYQFTPYEGSNKSYKEVKFLINNVIKSNSSYSNQVAIKLITHGKTYGHSVLDSAKFYISRYDELGDRYLYKCQSENIVSIDKILTQLDKYPHSNFKVELYYPTDYDVETISNNEDLNPSVRCVMLVLIRNT